MIPQNLFNILKNNTQVLNFLNNTVDFEVFFKRLNHDEIKRLSTEYPNLFKQEINDHQKINNKQIKIEGAIQSIVFIILVRRDLDSKNYTKLKKIKMYINESNGKIIKILQK